MDWSDVHDYANSLQLFKDSSIKHAPDQSYFNLDNTTRSEDDHICNGGNMDISMNIGKPVLDDNSVELTLPVVNVHDFFNIQPGTILSVHRYVHCRYPLPF